MLARLPFSQWPGRFLADGVHYTRGTTQFPATSDPYANGGDPATHTTGSALTFNGYGLKGWLGVQKMKEIKALVVDSVPPSPPPAPTDTTPPTVTSTTPASGATGVATSARVSATFSEAMTATSVTTTTFQLRNAANTVVAATLSYNASTRVATLTPSQALASSASYTATITGGSAGVKDSAGNAMAANRVWSFNTAAAPTTPGALTIFSASSAPTTYATTDGSAVELGLKFRSDVAGTVTGVRFYKGTRTTGTHTGTLWSSTGTRLATATFTGETASGWQQVTFSTPVSITANTVYVVSYHSDIGNYAYTHNTFANAGVDNGPLHALQAGVSGGNGVFRYGGAVFPDQSFNSSNYWVDVVFVPR